MPDFDLDAATARILHVYSLARHDQLMDGMDWYEDTRTQCAVLARASGTTITRAVGVLAALSPGVQYERSFTLARALLGSGDAPHPYGDAIRKAKRIANGEPPLDVLGGNKVRAFYDNIRRPRGSTAVTIDRHAYAITVAGPDDFGPRGGALVDYHDLARKGMYEAVADAYRHAAHAVGIRPMQMQAVTWVTWRGEAR